jgi:hypothetical protein
MRVQPYSIKRQVATLGFITIPLAKADDAYVIEGAEPAFGDPAMDAYGGGLHMENTDGHGKVTIQVPPNQTAAIAALEAFRKARQAAEFMAFKDMGSATANAILKDVVCSNPDRISRGNTRGNIEYEFTYISADVTEGGARIIP